MSRLPKTNREMFNRWIEWIELTGKKENGEFINDENLLKQEFARYDKDTQDYIKVMSGLLKEIAKELVQ